MKKNSALIIFFFTFLSNQLLNMLTPILPTLQTEFEVDTFRITLAVFAVIFARMVVSLPLGRYFKVSQLKNYLLASFALISLGFFLVSRASAYWPFLISVFIGALGSATVMIFMLLYVSKTSQKENRGRMLGFYQSGLMIAAALAPIYSGYMNRYFGWRQGFMIMSIFLLLVMGYIFLARLPGSGREVLDSGEGNIPDDQSVEEVALRSNRETGEVADLKEDDPAAAEISGESCGTRPGEGEEGLNLRTIIIINFVTFSLLFTMGGFAKAIIPLLGGNLYQLTSDQIGIGLSAADLIRFLVLIGGSYISDRYSRRHIIVPGLLIGGVGMLLMATGGELLFYYAGIVLFAVGRIGNNFIVSLLCDQVPAHKIGMLTSVNRFVADTGLLTGPIILGWVMSYFGVNMLGILAALISWTAALSMLFFISEKRKRRAEAG